ncbi:FHA domain-containing protein [Bordetella sp. 15P40C-2]|uniref:FHA domain-containing protein n=1 Tax=Bordetella sp. 15P40C-2 TaxID=2572246 RepID=UPI001EFFDA5A|nr:FHA domain-containing protein [Bordetella sp. 15P40C-2]
MKLTVQQRPDESGLIAPWSTVFHAPGGTIGRSPDNALRLPDPQRDICRVQAAVRITDNACYLVNLSSMSEVRLNGRQIERDQELPLTSGDQLQIGPYTILAQDPDIDAMAGVAAGAAAATPLLQPEPDPLLESPLLDAATPASEFDHASAMADPAQLEAVPEPVPDVIAEPVIDRTARSDTLFQDPVAQIPNIEVDENVIAGVEADSPQAESSLASDTETSAQSDDVFSGLFGPGTLPVGSVPDASTHPFDMESAGERNPEDPLRQLPRGDANVSGPARDPLELLDSHEGPDVEHVFSDPTPSTLPAHDPLAPHRLDPLRDTFDPKQEPAHDQWTARDHTRETGGFLRPSRVRSETPERAPEAKHEQPPARSPSGRTK